MQILNSPYFALAIVICIAVEYFYSKRKGLQNYNGWETYSNLILIILDKILGLLTGTNAGFIGQWLWEHRLFELNFSRSVNLAITFFAVEFLYYCNHWYHHNTNLGWATHIMHHSPTKYNFTLGYRLGLTRLISLGWLVFLPAIYLGLNPDDVLLCIGIIFLLQFFIHTEFVPPIPLLDKVLNTPVNHRVHHSSNPAYYNKNLGGLTVIFDHLFGTYVPFNEKEEMRYGIEEVMQKKSIIYEITFQWRKVGRGLVRQPGIWPKIKFLWSKPTGD